MHDEFDLEEYDEAVLEALSEQILEEDSQPAIINPNRLEHIKYAYAVLKRLAKDIPESRVFYKLNEPFKEVGSVSIEAKKLCFLDAEQLARAADLANNMEVYPMTNGKVRLTLTFLGVTTPIREGESE